MGAGRRSKPKVENVGQHDSAVSLQQAPHAFWPMLFPAEQDAAVATRRWIAELISGQREWPGFKVMALPKQQADSLAQVIDVNLAGNAARLIWTAAGPANVSAPLFSNGLGRWRPEWKTCNPLQAPLDNRDPLVAQSSHELFAAAVRRVGDDITQRTHKLLLDGKLVASAVNPADPFGNPARILKQWLSEATLDLEGGRLLSRTQGKPSLTDVVVRAAAELPKDKSGGQSFKADDQIRIEDMHELIKSGEAKNVTDAARQIRSKARSIGSDGLPSSD